MAWPPESRITSTVVFSLLRTGEQDKHSFDEWIDCAQFLTFATLTANLSKAGVTSSPSSRSRSPCRKNSSHARCDHTRDTLHGLQPREEAG